MTDWPTALSAVSPRLSLTVWQAPLQAAFDRFEINTPNRIAAACGQFLQESGETFNQTIEDLDYTTPARLAAVYPSHFPTVYDAAPYVNAPQALANVVYAGVNGNGDWQSGDGWTFRGRGLIQITGRAAYTALAAAVGMALADVPAWCETPAGAAMSGCWWLWSNGCLPLADGWEITAITRKVNPAMEGAGARLAYSNAMLGRLRAG